MACPRAMDASAGLSRTSRPRPDLVRSLNPPCTSSNLHDSALAVRESLSILTPVMGITRQAGEMNSNASGQAVRGGEAESAFWRTLCLPDRGGRRNCQPDANKGASATLSLYQ